MSPRCAVINCPCDRLPDALVCGSLGRGHLSDLYGGRLVRLAEGFVEREALIGRPPEPLPEPAWRTWTREHNAAKALA